jgi:hypothetical protein
VSCRRCIPGVGLCPNCTALLARAQGSTVAEVSEASLQAQLKHVCKYLNLLHYHTMDSRKSERGFPDSVILAPVEHPLAGTLYLVELKKMGETPSRYQQRWLDALSRVTRVESRLVYPDGFDVFIRQLQQRVEDTS